MLHWVVYHMIHLLRGVLGSMLLLEYTIWYTLHALHLIFLHCTGSCLDWQTASPDYSLGFRSTYSRGTSLYCDSIYTDLLLRSIVGVKSACVGLLLRFLWRINMLWHLTVELSEFELISLVIDSYSILLNAGSVPSAFFVIDSGGVIRDIDRASAVLLFRHLARYVLLHIDEPGSVFLLDDTSKVLACLIFVHLLVNIHMWFGDIGVHFSHHSLFHFSVV